MPVHKWVPHRKWHLQGLITGISSVYICEDNYRIYFCDFNNKSILEYNSDGGLVVEVFLDYHPFDICLLSPNTMAVVCGLDNKLILLDKTRKEPFLKIKQVFTTEKQFVSLSKAKDKLYACDLEYEIYEITEDGKIICQPEKLFMEKEVGYYRPIIRANPLKEDVSWLKMDSKQVHYSKKGQESRPIQPANVWSGMADLCMDENGQVYYCNYEGIFSTHQNDSFHKFEFPHSDPKFSVFRDRLVVGHREGQAYLLEIYRKDKYCISPDELKVRSLGKRIKTTVIETTGKKGEINEGVKKELITYVKLKYDKTLSFDVPETDEDGPSFYSIHVSEHDGHIFFCNHENQSIDEYTETGKFVAEFPLQDEEGKPLSPWDICELPNRTLVVACGWENRIIYLKRKENSSDFEIEEEVDTKKDEFRSLCQIEDTIFACDDQFQIVSYTKSGERIETVRRKETSFMGLPVIRSDKSSGNLWMTRWVANEVFCFNQSGEKGGAMKSKQKFRNYALTDYGCIFLSNSGGVYTFAEDKYNHEFEKKSEYPTTVSISRQKIYVHHRIDQKSKIAIFEIIED